jgi:hypothetical protein
MNLKSFNTYTPDDFAQIKETLSKVFDLDQRLPKQVFRKKFGYFLFEEFDWAMTPEFWGTLQHLSKASNDDYVIVAVVDPDPQNYFYNEFGFYNWLKLPMTLSNMDYFFALETGPEESPADAILYNTRIIAWCSPSMKWAVWGERTYGTCIIGFSDESTAIVPQGIWRSAEQALYDFIPVNFIKKQIPKEFSDALILNYPCQTNQNKV